MLDDEWIYNIDTDELTNIGSKGGNEVQYVKIESMTMNSGKSMFVELVYILSNSEMQLLLQTMIPEYHEIIISIQDIYIRLKIFLKERKS